MLIYLNIKVIFYRSQERWILIKCKSYANLNLSLTKDIYTIDLWCLTITNNDTLLSWGFHLCSLIFWNMDIDWQTKNPQVSNIQLVIDEDLSRGLLIQNSMVTLVLNIDGSIGRFFPLRRWKILVTHHNTRFFTNYSILPFNNPILLRVVWYY